MTYPNNTLVSYTYDTNNQLKRIALPQGAINIDTYSWTQPTQISYPGLTKTLSYDPVQRLTLIKLQANLQAPLLMDYRYQYDAASNISQKTTLEGMTQYQYDPLDRLTQANPPTTLGLPQEHYQYDALGNRITSLHQPGTFSYNANNQLTLAPQTQYQYDLNGHTTKEIKGPITREFSYDEAERLTEVKDNNVSLGQYQYDPLGRRIKKTTPQGSVYFHYSDEGLIAEYDATGTPLSFYGWQPNGTWGTNPQFTLQNNQAYYYHNDHLGTPQKLTDNLGKVVWQGKSEAFGKTTVDPASTVFNPLRFPGQYEDQETGLHYNYFRDYDPAVGRYVQSDPIGLEGGLNLYEYGKNNPLWRIDPKGLFTIEQDCCNKDSTIINQISDACRRVTTAITDVKLRACILERCKKGRVSCDGVVCWAISKKALGWAQQGKGDTANLCLTNNETTSNLEQFGCVAIHEWAHTCGWEHSSGGGVPGSSPIKFPSECKLGWGTSPVPVRPTK